MKVANCVSSMQKPRAWVLHNHSRNTGVDLVKLWASTSSSCSATSTSAKKFSNIFFENGVAKDFNGKLFNGVVKDTLKNGKDIELVYKNGRWQKSTLSHNGTSLVVEKFAKYNKDETISSVNKIYIQNNEPAMAKLMQKKYDYINGMHTLEVDTTSFLPVKKGQNLSSNQMDRCFRADFFKEYDSEKYNGLGIIQENVSHVFEESISDRKWLYKGLIDNLKRLMENLKN